MDTTSFCTLSHLNNSEVYVRGEKVGTHNCVAPLTCAVDFHCNMDDGNGFHRVKLHSNTGCCPNELDIVHTPGYPPEKCSLITKD
jgi:hypothetical protein